ncbi:MAG: DHH family phosphoesterase [Verrucomicrobia bacterium]|nr:DHH family phosphoesterase [Verrucomicrobiota bacterium]
MPTFAKPDVILTHESDLDGFTAGILLRRLAKKLHGADVRLEAWNYQAWKNRPMSERVAWICDFTYEPRFDKADWLIVDHHTTDLAPKQAQLIHDKTRSAGLLAYDLCRAEGLASPALDRLVHFNNVADLFLEDDPDFVLAQDYANLVKTYGFWNLHAVIEGELERLLDHPLLEVIAVKRRLEDPLGYEWSRPRVVAITPELGLVNTVIGNVNLIVYRLLDEWAVPHPVLVTLFRKANGLMIASFRSRDGGALRVAEKLAGGGHPNASGATLPRSVTNAAEAVLHLRKVLEGNPPATTGPLNSLGSLLDGFTPAKG